MPEQDSKPPVRGGTNQSAPKYRMGDDVVFRFSGNLSGLVRNVRRTEDGRVVYEIFASFRFEVSEGSVLCRTVEAERVLGGRSYKADKGETW